MKDFDIEKVEALKIWQRKYRLTENFSRSVAIGLILMVVFSKIVLIGSIVLFAIALVCSIVQHLIEGVINKMVGVEENKNED